MNFYEKRDVFRSSANGKSYHIDINVCSSCNLGCQYCSEGKNLEPFTPSRVQETKTKVLKEELYNFVDKINATYNPDNFVIAFWGGEPFLNFEYCYDVMMHYSNDPKMFFFFYTNGIYVKKYLHLIKNFDSIAPGHLNVQISYDGGKVNDVERLTKNKKSTSKAVKDAYLLLRENNISVDMKSTVSPRTFKYMYSAFVDIISLPDSDNYFPSPDAFSEYDSKQWPQYYADLKKNISLIAKYIYDHNLPLNSFRWFENNKALCGAGIQYVTIDLNGNVTPCHSCMYDTESQHKIGNIRELDIIQKIQKAEERFKNLMSIKMKDPVCSKCTSPFCVRCPAGSFNLSYVKKNTEHLSGQARTDARWLARNIDMCQVFKINEIVYNSLLKTLKNRTTKAV